MTFITRLKQNPAVLDISVPPVSFFTAHRHIFSLPFFQPLSPRLCPPVVHTSSLIHLYVSDTDPYTSHLLIRWTVVIHSKSANWFQQICSYLWFVGTFFHNSTFLLSLHFGSVLIFLVYFYSLLVTCG